MTPDTSPGRVVVFGAAVVVSVVAIVDDARDDHGLSEDEVDSSQYASTKQGVKNLVGRINVFLECTGRDAWVGAR
jgi:hypothetical protein